jgi:oxygen-independent coproporphyrinogen-3 oxidase
MMHPSLSQRLAQNPYEAYSYSYPHKTAYRHFDPPRPLAPLWAEEDRSALFLYLHVPFCTMRCGFCNLFALAQPRDEMVDRYVDTMIAQMGVLDDVLGDRAFARLAIGGGTPTFLEAAQLERLFEGAGRLTRRAHGEIPAGIEVSPETVTPDRMAVCRAAGIDRVSMGVQSFLPHETSALVRPQQHRQVDDAIALIRKHGFPTLNLDLIYGIAGQTVDSLIASLKTALAYAPEELYLYPLYVRALTGLDRRQRRGAIPLAQAGDPRPALYRAARDYLVAQGYVQVSMRMFRAPHAPAQSGPEYCCQDDGMIGVGCGARSYTRRVHYSEEYGVGRMRIHDILQAYITRDPQAFGQASYGYALDEEDQRRRFVIQSLLTWPGLSHAAYRGRFGDDCLATMPQLAELLDLELASLDGDLLALTPEGMAAADVIGPWLISARASALMQAYEAA